MNPHHINGPSSLNRRIACPGSRNQEAPLWDLPQEATEEQEAGTEQHRVAAEGARYPLRRAELLATINPEYAATIAQWWEYWETLLGDDSIQEIEAAKVEHRIELPGGRHGTCDAYAIVRTSTFDAELIVADLKSTPVSPSSPQLVDYARGIWATTTISRVRTVVVSRAGVSERVWTIDQIDAAIKRIDKAIAATDAQDAPLYPGDHCGYCLARDTCPARRGLVAQTAALAMLRSPVAAWMTQDPETRGKQLAAIVQARKILAEAEQSIKELVRGGEPIEGWKLRRSMVKAWRDDAGELLEAAAVAKGIQPSELYELKSFAEVERILGVDALTSATTKRPGTQGVIQS